MTDAIYRSVFSSFERSIVHATTFSENALSMRAGLTTLDVLEQGAWASAPRASGTSCNGASGTSCPATRWSRTFAAKVS